MQSVLVINSKGGCGKTTVATNLAGHFANQGLKTALMDYDAQGSSLEWLSLRSNQCPQIHGVNASRTKTGVTRSWQLHLPVGTQRVVIDAPAGVNGLMLQEMVRRANVILIPVVPSPLDLHATADFVRDLLLVGKVRSYGVRVGVVANRVRRNLPLHQPLRRFLDTLNIPLVASLADSDCYLEAAAGGVSVHESERCASQGGELEHWAPLLQWVDDRSEEIRPPAPPQRLQVAAAG